MDQYDLDSILTFERDMWNKCADSYLDSTALTTAHAIDQLLEAACLSDGSRALDVGCGPGHIAKMMAEAGAVVSGVDIAAKMIETARTIYPGIEFIVADADDLPFEIDTFDAVLANFVIHHFGRPDIAIKEIHRVLKPGGRFVFAGPTEQFGFGGLIESILAHHELEDFPSRPITGSSTFHDYEQVIATVGFSHYDVAERVLILEQDNLDALFGTAWDMWDLDLLPHEAQDKIRAAAIERTAPFQTETGYAFPDRIIVGVATK